LNQFQDEIFKQRPGEIIFLVIPVRFPFFLCSQAVSKLVS